MLYIKVRRMTKDCDALQWKPHCTYGANMIKHANLSI